MAFRISNIEYLFQTHWKSILDRLGGRSDFATATSSKMKAYNPAIDQGYVYGNGTKPHNERKPVRGDFVPVYVAVGMILMSTSLGLYTVMHQLKRNPSIHLKKSRRETVPEVVDPDVTMKEGKRFVDESLMRKIAHIQDRRSPVVPDYIRGDPSARPAQAETLKTVGVDPKALGT